MFGHSGLKIIDIIKFCWVVLRTVSNILSIGMEMVNIRVAKELIPVNEDLVKLEGLENRDGCEGFF